MTNTNHGTFFIERRFAAVGLRHVVAAIGELLGDSAAQRRFVFDDQQMFLRVRHLSERQYFDTAQNPTPDREWGLGSRDWCFTNPKCH